MVKGYLTTEFYVSLLAMVLGALMASGLLVEGTMWAQIVGAIVSGLAALGYTGSRARVKAAESLKMPGRVVEPLPTPEPLEE